MKGGFLNKKKEKTSSSVFSQWNRMFCPPNLKQQILTSHKNSIQTYFHMTNSGSKTGTFLKSSSFGTNWLLSEVCIIICGTIKQLMRGIYQIRTVDIFEISVLTNSQCTSHHCRVRAAGEVNANDHHKLWGHWKRTHKQADIRRGGLFDRVSERYTRARPFQTKHRALLTQHEKRRGHERPDHPWLPHQKTKPRIGWQNNLEGYFIFVREWEQNVLCKCIESN